MSKYRSRHVEPPPTELNTALDRGHALSYFLDKMRIPVQDFAEVIGRDRTYLNRIFRGEVDLAEMNQTDAGLIITATGLTDRDAREMLGIPEDKAMNWRTFRPPPLGEGAPIDTPQLLELKQHSLAGEVSLPIGSTLHIVPRVIDDRLQVMEMNNLIMVVSREMHDHMVGRHLGSLIGADLVLEHQSLKGAVALPKGSRIHILPGENDKNIQIIRLADGRFHAAERDMAANMVGDRLGGLVSAAF